MIDTPQTQRDRVLARLRYDRAAGRVTCGNDLLALYAPRYGGRIFELRHDFGFGIETLNKCPVHDHAGNVHAYALTHDPDIDVAVEANGQARLVGIA